MEKHNYSVDIFRILCCIGVLTYHVMDDVLGKEGALPIYFGASFCIPGFFAIAGYLIAYSDLYKSFRNQKLREILMTLHHDLVGLFRTMNERLPTGEHEAHFWAEPSRDLIKRIEIIFVLLISIFTCHILVRLRGFVLIVLVLAKIILGQIVISCGVGFFLFEFQEVEGCAAAQQHHHKEHHKAAHATWLFLLRLFFLRLGLRLRPVAGGQVVFTDRAGRIDGPGFTFGRTVADLRLFFSVLQQGLQEMR